MGCAVASSARSGRSFTREFGRYGAITDDTQMAMFTAEGLLRAYACGAVKGSADVPSVVGHAYLRWLHRYFKGDLVRKGIIARLERSRPCYGLTAHIDPEGSADRSPSPEKVKGCDRSELPVHKYRHRRELAVRER